MNLDVLVGLPWWAPYALALVVLAATAAVSQARSSEGLSAPGGLSPAARQHLVAFTTMFVGGLAIGYHFPPSRVAAMLWRAVLEALPFFVTGGLVG